MRAFPQRPRSRCPWGPVALAIAAGLTGCQALRPPRPPLQLPANAPEVPRRVTRGPADDDAIVRVVVGDASCSGTLIAEDRVLTAHHCLSERTAVGDYMDGDVSPAAVSVELGGDYLPWGVVGVKAIVAPPCGHRAGRGDIAILMLERHLPGVTVLEPQLDRTLEAGDVIKPVGFGQCVDDTGGIKRRDRVGGPISRLLATRFRGSASVCPGDSGGPVLDAGGQLVGVVSSAVMDDDSASVAPAEFTRLDSWRSIFATARLMSEGTPAAEIPPIACE